VPSALCPHRLAIETPDLFFFFTSAFPLVRPGVSIFRKRPHGTQDVGRSHGAVATEQVTRPVQSACPKFRIPPEDCEKNKETRNETDGEKGAHTWSDFRTDRSRAAGGPGALAPPPPPPALSGGHRMDSRVQTTLQSIRTAVHHGIFPRAEGKVKRRLSS
jgi:hypothetical protein